VISRLNQYPPPMWWAELEAALAGRFPGIRWTRKTLAELEPYFVAEWRMGQRAKHAARTVCSCDGQQITLNPEIEVPAKRPPKGAKRGEIFGADELRDPARTERLKNLKAQLQTVQISLRKADKKQTEKLGREAARITAQIERAENPPPKPPRKARSARAAASCPPSLDSCKLGLTGGLCGLPAPLVLAAAQGSPVVSPSRFCLASVWSLVPSHNPLRGFAPNAAYPATVQERAYDRDKGEQLKVISIAQNLIPELVFNGAPGAIDGLPLVTAGGIVLGGNGRTQALQLHYSYGEQTARNYLLSHAGLFGFSKAQIEAVQDPVVVRVISTPAPDSPNYVATLRELVRLANIPLLQSLGAREEAVAEGRRLSDEALEILSVGLGDDLSLAEYLASRQSRAFAMALRRAGIVNDRNAARLLEADGESFSEDGKRLVERVLVGALLPDAALLEEAGAQLRGTLARGAPWILSAAAGGADWDLRPAITAAVRDLVEIRRRGVNVDSYLRQTGMDGGPAVLTAQYGESLLRVLSALGARPVAFGRFARRYAELSRAHPSAQGSLLPAEKVSPVDAIRQAAAQVSEV